MRTLSYCPLPVHHRAFSWTPSDDTDITDTWRKHGWKPTSELAEGIGDIRDDYQLVQDTDWLTDIGAFKS